MFYLKWYKCVYLFNNLFFNTWRVGGMRKIFFSISLRINFVSLFKHVHSRFCFFFPTQPQCSLIFSWAELHMSLRCCLIHINIIILRHFLHSLYLCPCLDLGRLMLNLCDLFLIFIFVFIMINCRILQTRLFFWLFFRICPTVWMITWTKNVNNFQIAKVQPQSDAYHFLDLLPFSAWRCL